MKLSHWAKKQGVCYKTAWNLFKAGHIPGAYKLGTGTIIVPEDVKGSKGQTVVYARVSSSENKKNLESQAERLVSFANARGWTVSQVIKEVGSGLNDNRKKLEKILMDKTIERIIVEHKDRFSRFGMNYIQKLLELDHRELIVVNPADNNRDDLMQDFVAIITSFTARLYGQRRTKRKTEKLIKELENAEK